MSIIGAPTFLGFPSAGWVCIRMPGPAFTSMITALFSRNGTEMSGVSTSIPAMSSPMIPAAISHAVMLSGCISSVRSTAVPPVERLAVPRRNTDWFFAGTDCRVRFCLARNATVRSSAGSLVRVLVCPTPRRGSRFSFSISCAMVLEPSPTTRAGIRSAHATTLPLMTSTR